MKQMIAKKEAEIKDQAAGIKTGEESIPTDEKNHTQEATAFKTMNFLGRHLREYKSFSDKLLKNLRKKPFQLRGVDRLEWRES